MAAPFIWIRDQSFRGFPDESKSPPPFRGQGLFYVHHGQGDGALQDEDFVFSASLEIDSMS